MVQAKTNLILLPPMAMIPWCNLFSGAILTFSSVERWRERRNAKSAAAEDLRRAFYSVVYHVERIEPILEHANTKWQWRFDPNLANTTVPWKDIFVLEAPERGVRISNHGKMGNYGVDEFWVVSSSRGTDTVDYLHNLYPVIAKHCGWNPLEEAFETSILEDLFSDMRYSMISAGTLNASSIARGEGPWRLESAEQLAHQARFFNEIYSGEASLPKDKREQLENRLKNKDDIALLVQFPLMLPVVPAMANIFIQSIWAGLAFMVFVALVMTGVSTGTRYFLSRKEDEKKKSRKAAFDRMPPPVYAKPKKSLQKLLSVRI